MVNHHHLLLLVAPGLKCLRGRDGGLVGMSAEGCEDEGPKGIAERCGIFRRGRIGLLIVCEGLGC